MFETPQLEPTMWKRVFDAAFGAIGRGLRAMSRVVRFVWDPIWLHPMRRPIAVGIGAAIAAVGFWRVLHEPFDWSRIEDDGSLGGLLMIAGGLLMMLGIRKSAAPRN
jgi:hypothetical protein